MFETVESCRSCGSAELQPFLSLGRMPLTTALLCPEQLDDLEPTYPLDVALCRDCALVQVLGTVPPELIFGGDYPHYSSFSGTLIRHAREHALRLIQTNSLDRTSLVIELASNDGYMLRNFVEHDIPVLGIDPARGPAASAKAAGIPTFRAFFDHELATRLRDEDRRADVIIANDVLSRVADPNSFTAGIAMLLKEDGIATIEVAYVKHLIRQCAFDTIDHEHLVHYSVTAVQPLLHRHGLFLNRVEEVPIHGGSLRLRVGRRDEPDGSVEMYLHREAREGIASLQFYAGFAAQIHAIKDALLEILGELKDEGKSIAAYGAAAKGIILLNYIGADGELVDFVVDQNVHKQGKYLPGVRIPIHDPAEIHRQMPDVMLLLPWDFKDEILEQQAVYRRRGGRFIIPIPSPTVV
jgi:hypothetical protein